MRKTPKRIGLAIVGAGRVGLFRGEVAARHPMVDFIGIADLKEDRLELVQSKTQADFATTDFRELLRRPEVTAAIIATDEHLHVEPILAACERKISLLIEKPLATELAESQRVLDAIQKAKVDAVVGYTQRFRRRWLAAKEKVRTGSLGDLLDAARMLTGQPLPAGRRLVVVSNAGGLNVLAADAAEAAGLHFPGLTGKRTAALPDNQRLDDAPFRNGGDQLGQVAHDLARLVRIRVQEVDRDDPPDGRAGGRGQRLHIVLVMAHPERIRQSALRHVQ